MEEYWLVYSKEDDYGSSKMMLIKCDEKIVRKFYYYKRVSDKDVEILKKYIDYEFDIKEIKRQLNDEDYGW